MATLVALLITWTTSTTLVMAWTTMEEEEEEEEEGDHIMVAIIINPMDSNIDHMAITIRTMGTITIIKDITITPCIEVVFGIEHAVLHVWVEL